MTLGTRAVSDNVRIAKMDGVRAAHVTESLDEMTHRGSELVLLRDPEAHAGGVGLLHVRRHAALAVE